MKLILKCIVLLAGVVILDSCSKTETKVTVSAAETNAALLAGAPGGNKSWKLTSISESINGGTASVVTSANGIPSCETDNIFMFSNNAAQSYTQTEGGSACNVGQTDPTTLESGSWAFTDNGKNLLIDGTIFVTSDQFTNEDPADGYFIYYFILSVGQPLTVTQLTATSLTVTFSGTFTDSNTGGTDTYTDILIFTASN